MAPSVRFVGQAADDEVDAWYHACDVFVLASREIGVSGGAEGYGIVFVEADLRGKPVVGGRSGGIPDAVIDGETGLLVDPIDPADIAEAVTRLLTEPDLAARLGRGGRRRAIEDLSWPEYTERFRRVLSEAAAGDRPARRPLSESHGADRRRGAQPARPRRGDSTADAGRRGCCAWARGRCWPQAARTRRVGRGACP